MSALSINIPGLDQMQNAVIRDAGLGAGLAMVLGLASNWLGGESFGWILFALSTGAAGIYFSNENRNVVLGSAILGCGILATTVIAVRALAERFSTIVRSAQGLEPTDKLFIPLPFESRGGWGG